jgi:mannan endo-1,4-beta-mannosidase
MKVQKPLFFAFCFFLIIFFHCGITSGLEHFITRQGDKLMDGSEEFRFISFNIPNLHYIEDNLPFDETNPWRLPDEFEITDALTAIKQAGGKVARIYTLSVRKPGEDPNIPRHVLGPGQFNEQAFAALDKVLETANKTGVRVIIPFVDNWIWWGGIAEYAGFRGKSKEYFWTDPQIIADFKKTVEYVINRTNTYTGIKYKDDKAILAWETGNELQCPARWTHEIAEYVKSLDRNHLLIDGFHTSILRDESIDDPLVDIVTTHHYPKNPREMLEQVKASHARAKGKKPYFIGEFGFVPTDAVRKLLDIVINDGISGALIWSLRFRSRDGGFYWHSEPFGGDRYKAYHWPGFESGDEYDEHNLLKLMCQKAYQIQGLSVPPLSVPQPPRLLPINNATAISWQGSTGATSYTVERAFSEQGPWIVVGQDISDAEAPYRPLFVDANAEIGKQYFYRVTAKNDSGISKPSNAEGPVEMRHLTLIDEMKDFSLICERGGSMVLESKQARKTKEDMNRLKLNGEAYIVYKVPLDINQIKVYSFISGQAADIELAVSADGENFAAMSAQRKEFVSGAGESEAYGYLRPVSFTAVNEIAGVKYLKVKSTGDIQISRVEINYGGTQKVSSKEQSILRSAP